MPTVTHTRKYPSAAAVLAVLSSVVLLAASCGTGQDEDGSAGEGPRTSPQGYVEGDTLDAVAAPALDAWVAHYRKADTAFRRNAFLASGINLPLDSLDACPAPDKATLRLLAPILAWSPDSTLAIDIWSYDHLARRNRRGTTLLEGGGPDQMAKLIDRRSGSARQVLFNGPSQIVETADWISDNAFVLGLLNIDEATGEARPDILLIHLGDSLFTNFRYPGPALSAAGGFMEGWLRSKGIRYE